MNTIERERFTLLIAFLEDMPKELFDFDKVVSDSAGVQTCGTVCCAIGWTPVLFPELVSYVDRTVASTRFTTSQGRDFFGYVETACTLFGFDDETANSLFTPGMQHFASMRLPDCQKDATPQQVAAMLKEYLRLKDLNQLEC